MYVCIICHIKNIYSRYFFLFFIKQNPKLNILYIICPIHSGKDTRSPSLHCKWDLQIKAHNVQKENQQTIKTTRTIKTKTKTKAIIMNIKIDTIQYLKVKNVKGKTPNYSGRDSIKGSSSPYFHNGPHRGYKNVQKCIKITLNTGTVVE